MGRMGNLTGKVLIISSLFALCRFGAQSPIDLEVRKEAARFPGYKDFRKAAGFFLKKEYDSTLVYASRHLEEYGRSPDVLTNYCRYFRGVAFKEKRMFGEAEAELKKIPPGFVGYRKTVAFLGDTALEQDDFRKALQYYGKVRKYRRLEGLEIDEGRIDHNTGLCYLHLGKFKAAEEFLFKGLKWHREKKDSVMMIGSYMDLGNLYYEQYLDHLAIPYYEKAYKLSQKIGGNYLIKKNASLNMAVVEENRKRYLKALEYRKASEAWNDSLSNQTRIWQDAQHEKLLAVKSKQNEIDILQAENKIRILEKNRMIYAVFLLIIILLSGIYFYLQKSRDSKVILKQKIRLDESNATKDLLFSVISHDLRSYINSLKRIYSAMLVSAADQQHGKVVEQIRSSASIVDSTHRLLNNLFSWAMIQTGQLYFNPESIDMARIIEQVAYNSKSLMDEKHILFENKVTDSLKVYADQESLKMIIRNLLDNAVKYTGPGGKIVIRDFVSSAGFHGISVEDTGIGIAPEHLRELEGLRDQQPGMAPSARRPSGFGLQLCRLMTEKNSGSLEIVSEKNKGTKIMISLLKG